MRRCRTVDHFESRLAGYRVAYEYQGRTYTTFLPYDPGSRLPGAGERRAGRRRTWRLRPRPLNHAGASARLRSRYLIGDHRHDERYEYEVGRLALALALLAGAYRHRAHAAMDRWSQHTRGQQDFSPHTEWPSGA